MSREGYARILFQMNRKAEARAAFLTAFRLDPEQRDCAIEAGLIGIELGEWEAAVNCFKQLEKPSGPPEADLLIGLARLRLHQGDAPGARRLLAEARKSTVSSHHTPGRLERLALALEAESGAGAKTGSDG
jgi:tetratricopeptide (TPR) repeat protein